MKGVSLFGAVGSYSWSGGIVEAARGVNATFINASALETDMQNSYLGENEELREIHYSSFYKDITNYSIPISPIIKSK